MEIITREEAIKEMRFLFNGYKALTSCSNPSKANIKLMQACELAIIALEQYQEDKEQPQGDLISREALKKEIRQEVIENRVGVFVAKRIINLIDNAPTVHHPNCDICEDKAKQYSMGFQDGYMTGKARPTSGGTT